MIEIVKGDLPIIRRNCVDLNGAPIDLTTCTTAVLRIICGFSPVVSRTMTITTPLTAGIVQYQFVVADTPSLGSLKMEVALTFQDGTVITSPVEDDIIVRAKFA